MGNSGLGVNAAVTVRLDDATKAYLAIIVIGAIIAFKKLKGR